MVVDEYIEELAATCLASLLEFCRLHEWHLTANT